MRFALRMAWRDFRARPSYFIFYLIAIALGVSSLTAIESFRKQLERSIDVQGKNLLGADLLLRSIRPFTQEQLSIVDQWPGHKAQSISFRTVLLVPESGATRLVEVEATEGGFPFYGGFVTDPAEAATNYHQLGEILLDHMLMMQLSVTRGDEVQVGGIPYVVAGALMQMPGEVPARSMMAPRIVIPYKVVDQDRFNRPGSMAKYEWYLALDSAKSASTLEPFMEKAKGLGLDMESVASRREQLMGNTARLGRYLGLMGFTALMMSCLGVAGAVHFFISSKRMAVAQLRCLGASLAQAAGMFIAQLTGLAVAGCSVGVGLGVLAAYYLPRALASFLPVPVSSELQWEAALLAWVIGFVFTIGAGFLPITQLRFISPLLSLRVNEAIRKPRLDAVSITTGVVLVVSLLFCAAHQLESLTMAILYVGGVGGVLGVLLLIGMLVRRLCRWALRPQWSYALRLAVSGLYRPQNQTGLLMMSMGMGVFLMTSVDILERHLLADVEVTRTERPNIAMIDVQVDQREALLARLAAYHPEKVFVEPMITMRLAAINGTPVEKLEVTSTGATRPNWALKREYRTTYRSEIKSEIENVIAGTWVGHAVAPGDEIPISLEKGIADALHVGVGDRLRFDIHGEMFETQVANLREVNWKSMQPNFFVIFPPGVIEEAPQSLLIFCQMNDRSSRALFQRDLATDFPNVTAIDISLMMDTVSTMMNQLAAAIRSIAWFTLSAGFLVMIAIIHAGQAVRQREAILMRTIGASRRLILSTQVGEYFILACCAMISGVLLAWMVSGLVVQYGMKMDYDPAMLPPWWISIVLLALGIFAGFRSHRQLVHMKTADAWRRISFSS